MGLFGAYLLLACCPFLGCVVCHVQNGCVYERDIGKVAPESKKEEKNEKEEHDNDKDEHDKDKIEKEELIIDDKKPRPSIIEVTPSPECNDT
mmetsp:Transcript_17302/g.32834  ORF Transcript_17302/g.32834 Transcript_17302/m.32834 type:complete len:92 (+) Transcript_17302:157-432(+)